MSKKTQAEIEEFQRRNEEFRHLFWHLKNLMMDKCCPAELAFHHINAAVEILCINTKGDKTQTQAFLQDLVESTFTDTWQFHQEEQ